MTQTAAPSQDLAMVLAVAASPAHEFSKKLQDKITLLKGMGVKGDAHCGVRVKHRSRVAKNPDQPNLRQIHLLHSEFFDEVASQGFAVTAGDLGENITTRGIDLLGLPTGTRLQINDAVIELTGLRNPCKQIEAFQTGLLKASLDKAEDGAIIRKAGVMGVIIAGGEVRPNDSIHITVPETPHHRLEPV